MRTGDFSLELSVYAGAVSACGGDCRGKLCGTEAVFPDAAYDRGAGRAGRIRFQPGHAAVVTGGARPERPPAGTALRLYLLYRKSFGRKKGDGKGGRASDASGA